MKRNLIVAVCVSLTISTARAQLPSAAIDTATNNLQHPPQTVLGTFGQLGHVERRGIGPIPVILIPGTPFGWTAWEEFMRRNVHRYTMYAITLPGHDGTAPWPMPATTRADGTPDYTRREWSTGVVTALARLIATQKLDRPLVVSNHRIADSYALRLALEHPDKVRGVVVSAGSPGWRLPPGVTNRDQWVHENRVPFFRTVSRETWRANMAAPSRLSRDSAYSRKLVAEQAAASIPTQIRYFLEFLATEIPPLEQLRVPLLALDVAAPFGSLPEQVRTSFLQRANGDADAARRAYEEYSQWRAVGVPAAFRSITFRDSGIFLMHDRPSEFDAAIHEFATRLR